MKSKAAPKPAHTLAPEPTCAPATTRAPAPASATTPEPERSPALRLLHQKLKLRQKFKLGQKLLWLVGIAGFFALCFMVVLRQPGTGPSPFSVEAWQRLYNLLEQFAGSDTPNTPAYQEASFWRQTLKDAVDTLEMSVLAISFAGLGILLGATTALRQGNYTRNYTRNCKPSYKRKSRPFVFGWLLEFLFVICRAVPDIVWALLIVYIFRPGVFAGALALGLHNFGVLGRLTSGEVRTDVRSGTTQKAITSLSTTGASRTSQILYGVLPLHSPQLLTFYLYRWEVIIRTTVIVGFITEAGLGFSLRLALSYRFFTEIAGILMVYCLLVFAVDLIAATLRKLAKL